MAPVSSAWRWRLVVVLAASAGVGPARAAGALSYRPAEHLPLALTAGAAWGASELLKPHLAAARCRWCASPPWDDAARAGLRWANPDAADAASNWVAYGALPLGALSAAALGAASEDGWAAAAVDAAVVAEAFAVSGALAQAFKFSFARERPFVHALPEALKARTADRWDNNVSFLSGHTAAAFSLAAAAGTVADLRGYPWAPWVWGAGLSVAGFTGYLRIAADRHHLTDVLAGAALGAVVGVALPRLLHAPRASDERPRAWLVTGPDGAVLGGVRGRF